jgi:hypothetical protein
MKLSGLLIMVCLSTVLGCSSAHGQLKENYGDQLNLEVGVDHWQLRSDTTSDFMPGLVNNYSNLFFPNSYINENYKPTSEYFRINTTTALSNDLTFNLRVRADQTVGLHVDSLQLDKQISPQLGFRAGVIRYNTSWCRTYDTDNPWVREINPLCSANVNIDITGGAPGVSAYTDIPTENLLIQSFVGIFNPLIAHYAPNEFGTTVTSNSMQVTENRKIAFSTNIIDLNSGVEGRISFLQANQYGQAPLIESQNHQVYNSIYLGLNVPISSNQQIRYTYNTRSQSTLCLSATAPMAVCNIYHNSRYENHSIEWNYQINASNVVALAYDLNTVGTTAINYNNTLTLSQTLNPDINNHTTLTGFSWRHEWTAAIYSAFQIYKSAANSKYLGLIDMNSNGTALGLRIAYQY